MTLSRKTSRIYLDEYDLQGAINALDVRIDDYKATDATPYYEGAQMALEIIFTHEEIRDQSIFMMVFDRCLEDLGIKPTKNWEDQEEKENS